MGNNQITNLIFKTLNHISLEQYQVANDIIESILNNKSNSGELNDYHWQYIGDICLALGKNDLARSSYLKANNKPGVAFTLIIQDRLQEAGSILIDANNSPASFWCHFLIELFSEQKQIKHVPSFLVVRHFLELTVYYLLLNKSTPLVLAILKNLNKLLEINLDSEKLIGYAYFSFGDLDYALKLLINASKRNNLDGEIFFMLGRLYIMKKNYHEAMSMLHNAQLLLPEHYPTQVLIESIRTKI